MKVTVDRFEGDFAVCEKPDRTMMNISKAKLPRGAKEGDILNIDGETIKIDSAATTARKKSIDKLTKDLWK